MIKLTDAERKQMIDLCKNLKGSLTLLQKMLADDIMSEDQPQTPEDKEEE